MKLDQKQIEVISKYFSDLSKILFASTVLGFIIPSESIEVSSLAFILGSLLTMFSFVFSIIIVKQNKI